MFTGGLPFQSTMALADQTIAFAVNASKSRYKLWRSSHWAQLTAAQQHKIAAQRKKARNCVYQNSMRAQAKEAKRKADNLRVVLLAERVCLRKERAALRRRLRNAQLRAAAGAAKPAAAPAQ
jgi:hypothetical protein